MKKLLLGLIVALFFLIACNREVNIEVPPITGEPSAALLGNVVTKTGDDYAEFEVDFHVVDDRGQFVRGLNKEDFELENIASLQDFDAEVVDLKRNLKTEFRGDYEVMFLMDQSGSIEGNDPYDSRITAANIFLDKVGENDNVGISSFNSGNFKIHVNPGQEIERCRVVLNGFKFSEFGGTPLYFSTYKLIDFLNSSSQSSNKALIVFTDGDDTDGVYSPTQIIENAKDSKVQIFTVGLGNSLRNLDILSNMATETGGYFMLAEDADQLISYFGSLGQLLYGNASYYKVKWRVKTSSTLNPGTVLRFNVEIKLSPVVSITVPILVTI